MVIRRFGMISILILTITIFFLTSCNSNNEQRIESVGMLVENSINDQTWGNKGYKGLLDIKEEFDVDVYFKEEIQTQQDVNKTVEEFAAKGVNIIFGHSSIYGKMFNSISSTYPDIQFIYFNGGYYDDNLTSLHFSSHAMGFFGGMVAGEMTDTNNVGLIAAYEWQPEIEGFYEGVHFQNPNASVHMEVVNNWDDQERAIQLFNRINDKDVDVFYPAGDTFSVSVIREVKKLNKYAIGYVSDQLELGENTVLTSTVQHVDRLYSLAAKKYNQNELGGGIFTYDFQDDVISLGEFSSEVPDSFKRYIEDEVDQYIDTRLLPNER